MTKYIKKMGEFILSSSLIQSKIELLASYIGHSPKELERLSHKLFGTLGLDSLTLTRVRGFLEPKPTYQILSGLTIKQVAERISVTEENKTFIGPDILEKDSEFNAFPLTPMQESYVIGAMQECPCQIYTEIDVSGLEVEFFKQALRAVTANHPMLHARIVNNSHQEIRDKSEYYQNMHLEISESTDLDKRREECLMRFKSSSDLYWDVQLTRLDSNTVRIHIIIDMVFIDAVSAMQICREVATEYENILTNQPSDNLVTNNLTFQSYCNQLSMKSVSEESLNYWNARCNEIPDPPQLPRLKNSEIEGFDFQRECITLDSNYWNTLKKLAQKVEITPNSLVLAAFSEVLRLYSENPDFSVAVTMSGRPVDKGNDFSGVVGEYTDIILCPITNRPGSKIVDAAVNIHNTLCESLEYNDVTGLDLIRMLRNYHEDQHLSFPIVFTSFLGVVDPDLTLRDCEIKLHYQQTQTPQITLDHQIYEMNGNLQINWDYDAKVYSKSLINEMLNCFHSLLQNIATNGSNRACLPQEVLDIRKEMNQTSYSFESNASFLLHELILQSANKSPESVAVIDQDKKFTYGEIVDLARAAAVSLQEAGVKPGSCVAIVLEKGWEQIVGTLAVLITGASYLPLNPNDPDERLRSTITLAKCTVALTNGRSMTPERNWNRSQDNSLEDVMLIRIDSEELIKINRNDFVPVNIDPDESAYIIFTSGSTGLPKGVEISHYSAVNTCLDINKRFCIQNDIVTFGISSLNFDLSVWDIFGTLGAGGTLVICKPDGTRDPDYWWSQIQQHNITVWNTVPTTFEMLLSSYSADIKSTLKVVMLSGDAINMSLANKALDIFPEIQLVGLGGATEASIWSNFHMFSHDSNELETELMPYGQALSNQTIYVLDSELEYRPTGVTGEIYIGGVGLAKGYFCNPELTQEKFIDSPHFGRLYKTGDIGRYLNNGEIEILGRRDMQVKIGGHRVELGEIERCIESLPNVNQATIIAIPGDVRYLVGFVTTYEDQEGLEEELRIHVEKFLPPYMIPKKWMVLESIPLTPNNKVDINKLRQISMSNDENSNGNNSGVSNSESILILQQVAKLLSVSTDSLNPSKSLFEQGVSSLHAIQLVNILSKMWNSKLPYSLLFNYPSIEKLAGYRNGLRRERKALERPTSANTMEPIAIVGSACRLPGNVASPEEFWDMLLEGKDCVTDVPLSRFNIDEVYDPNPDAVGCSYTNRGAFIKDVEKFDFDFFSIPIAEARSMDPQQRMLLEVAYEACHNAGYDKRKLMGSATGVFVGQMNYDWMTCFDYSADYAGTGVAPAITSNRISYALDLTGPSLTIDTACSSSLVAVDAAVSNLRSGSCNMAIAGGANLILSSDAYVTTSQAGMLSVDGRCATFDNAANGIVRGEGIGTVVLKRLSDAQADGDPILAVIRGSAVNQDGRSASLTVPNGHAQEVVIKQALNVAGLEGRDVDYIECHGTGTPLGDPIEVEAIKNVLGDQRSKPLVLGSVKTNIGHLEGAAGIIGLIKTIEVLRHRKAPGNVHFKTLNPKINLDDFAAIISSKSVDLRSDEDNNNLIAAVSSFGYGGTNAHVLVESWEKESHTRETTTKVANSNFEVDASEAGSGFVSSTNSQESSSANAPLFRSVSLPWNKSVITEPSTKPVDKNDLTESLFETEWVSLPSGGSEPSLGLGSYLIISRDAINLELPQGWQGIQVSDKKELEAILTQKAWTHVAMLSTGHEEDVKLALWLLQAVGRNTDSRIKQICFATKFGSTDDAGLWGLSRTFRLEYPEIRTQCLEYKNTQYLLSAIGQCFERSEEDEFLSDQNGKIHVSRLRRCTDIESSTKLSLRGDASYIISGGQGALGLVAVDLLVRRGAKYIVLLSRSSMKPEVEDKLINLRKHANIELLSCDVSQEVDVLYAKAWLERKKWPAVRGIVHTAGVLSDGTIQNQSSEKLQVSYSAKVNGARYLHDTFMPPDFLLLFSSAAATFGSAGQGNYAAANATLDALALKWSRSGDSVLSVQWGAWSDGGMAERHSTVKRAETTGFGFISNELGEKAIEQLLASSKKGVICITPIDWSNLQLNIPLVSRFGVKINEDVLTRGMTWTIPVITEIVKDCMLQFIPSSDAFESNHSFMEAGFSSLDLVQFRQKLLNKLPNTISLPAHFAFNYPTADDVIKYLYEQLKLETSEPDTNVGRGMSWSIPVITEIVKDCMLQFISSSDAFESNHSFMEAGFSSLDLVQFRQKLLNKLPNTINLPAHFAFNYPTANDVIQYLYEQLRLETPEPDTNAETWTLIRTKEESTPIFLIGGIVGSAERTFGTLADAMRSSVYTYMPSIPVEINPNQISIEIIAKELKEALLREIPRESYIIGGLSFGATIAIELALQLEKEGRLEQVIMIEPRHVYPYVAPETPAPFETLLEYYKPSGKVNNPVLLLQTKMMPLEKQSEIMIESSRGFQDDTTVLKHSHDICTKLEVVQSEGHHFNLLYKHADFVAKSIERSVTATSYKPYLTEPIAIIGTACRLPGNVASPEEFWDMLLAGTDCVTDVPLSRFDIDEVYDPNPDAVGRSYTKSGAFMKDVENFDRKFFNVSVTEARTMDPQQRLLLEVAYEAFHNAGYDKENLRGSNTSVHIGLANDDWRTMKGNHDILSPYFGSGVAGSIVANRISYLLGLTGPSMAIDTACSSSLVAIDLAVEKLRNGICSTALVGGVNVMLHPRSYIGCCAAKMLSFKGRCATFDEEADGYCRGEGVGAVVLKRLSDAQADGDPILAVIRGSAVNQDGRSASLTAPNGPAQEAVIKQALNVAGLEGRDVDYIECHGTGTSLGDPIEVEAIKNVLGDQRSKPLVLGSVKTNIGHLEGAAGIIGLIKTIEVLRHRKAPGNVHFKTLNPKINLDNFNAVISAHETQLGTGNPNSSLIGSISSFGFGGTNAHIILESYNYESGKKNTKMSYNPFFLPWRRLPHPFLSRYDGTCFVAKVSADQAEVWQDHRIDGKVVVPAASHLTTLAGAVILRNNENIKLRGVELQDVIMTRSLVISNDNTFVRCVNDGTQWSIQSDSNGVNEQFASCSNSRILMDAPLISEINIDDIYNRCSLVDESKMYDVLSEHKVQFGPKYRNLKNVHIGENEGIARIETKYSTALERSLTLLHPATLDAGLQLLGLCAMKVCGVCIPFHVKSARVYSLEEQPEELFAYAEITKLSSNNVEGTVTLFNINNEICAVLEGLICREIEVDTEVSNNAFETEWVSLPSGGSEPSSGLGSYLMISRDEINIELPQGWQGIQVSDKKELEAILTQKAWTHVAMLSTGHEEDVKLALWLLQAVGRNTDSRIKQICFATKFGSTDDAGLWGLSRTFRLEYPEIRTQCLEYKNTQYLLSAIGQCFERSEEDEFLSDQNGKIHVSRLRRCTDIESSTKLSLRGDASYIISGGQGALGLVAVDLLVRRGAKYI
ncbi:amino acid adenylation domain-containing protein [Bacillus subtilis subsp. subtilis]|nr:amino acid adenylation domain-containing protein [Bacillus subtilis subsp. subtilis]